MTELSIEEKAKAYDEAIKELRGLLEGIHEEKYDIMEEDIIKIFPELKESEDEEIRKDILNYIKHNYDGQHISISRYDSWIAWLERQGKPQVRTGLEWVNTIDDACDKRYSEEYAHGEYCHEQSFKWGFQEGVDWLEEQDEQKPADKVEPKFKVGDWCIDNEDGTIFQITKVLDNTYTYKTNEGKEYSCPRHTLENDTRLWTIQDAKDGDVLASNRSIFLFSQEYIAGKPEAYCGIMNGLFLVKPGGCWTNEKCYPATKEQRNLLFKKMKEAGYNWDTEKKELKKIEQNSTWSEEDEDYYDAIIAKLEVTQDDALLTDNQMEFLKSLKDRYTWKPSDGQILALKHASNDCSIAFADMKILATLYEQLKALHRYGQDT